MVTTTTQHMNARGDLDLQARFVAKAELMGVENASTFIQANMAELVTIVVEAGQTIGDVHAYAKETRDSYIAATPPPPGQNLGAVTDDHLAAAITATLPVEEPSP